MKLKKTELSKRLQKEHELEKLHTKNVRSYKTRINCLLNKEGLRALDLRITLMRSMSIDVSKFGINQKEALEIIEEMRYDHLMDLKKNGNSITNQSSIKI